MDCACCDEDEEDDDDEEERCAEGISSDSTHVTGSSKGAVNGVAIWLPKSYAKTHDERSCHSESPHSAAEIISSSFATTGGGCVRRQEAVSRRLR